MHTIERDGLTYCPNAVCYPYVTAIAYNVQGLYIDPTSPNATWIECTECGAQVRPNMAAPGAVAVILNDDDPTWIDDSAYNWETAQSIALDTGKRVVALTDDGYMTRDQIQELCDSERARYLDCFAPDGSDPLWCTDCGRHDHGSWECRAS